MLQLQREEFKQNTKLTPWIIVMMFLHVSEQNSLFTLYFCLFIQWVSLTSIYNHNTFTFIYTTLQIQPVLNTISPAIGASHVWPKRTRCTANLGKLEEHFHSNSRPIHSVCVWDRQTVPPSQ